MLFFVRNLVQCLLSAFLFVAASQIISLIFLLYFSLGTTYTSRFVAARSPPADVCVAHECGGNRAWLDAECSTSVKLVLTAPANDAVSSISSPFRCPCLCPWPGHAAAHQPAAAASRSDDASSSDGGGSNTDPVPSDSAAAYDEAPA